MSSNTDPDSNIKHYKTIFNCSLDAILLTHPDGTIFYVNPAAEELFGYKDQEVFELGRNGLVNFKDENLKMLMDERKSSGNVKGEINLLKRNGKRFPAEVSTSTFINSEGTECNFMIIRDISRRKEKEKQIAYHSLLLSKVNDTVIGVDASFTISYWNGGAEKMYGYTENEAHGRNIYELLHQSNKPGEYFNFNNNENKIFQTSTRHKNGKEVIVEVNSTTFKDETGSSLEYVFVYHNITVRKREEKIKQKLLEHEQQLTEQLQNFNEELQSISEELQATNIELLEKQEYLLKINTALEERKQLSEALNHVNANINSKHDYNEIMQSIMEEGAKSLKVESSVVNLLEDDKWVVKYVYNFPNHIKGQVKSHEDSPTSVYVAAKKEAVAFNDALNDSRVNKNGMKMHGVASLLAAPIILKDSVIGVIVFYHHKNAVNFSEAQIDFANKLSYILSQAIENAQLFESIIKSKTSYHSLYSSMNEGVAIHDIIYNSKHEAVDYVITDINNSYETILRLNKDDVIGKKASEIYGSDKPPFIDVYARVALTGKSESFKTYFEPMRKHFSISVISPEKDKFATVFEDITERIENERKLLRSEIKYRSIINNLQDGFIRADKNGKIVMASPSAARMYRFDSTDEMEEMNTSSIYKYEKDQILLLKKLNENGKVNDFESTALRKDGTCFSISVNAQYHYGENGQVLGVEAFVRDMTERKQIEAEIINNQKLLDAINQIFQESLTAETEMEVIRRCLVVSESLTESEFGFFGEINKNGRLDDRALSPPAWKKCQTPHAMELLKDMDIVSYWGRTIKGGKSQIVNDPDSDPDRRGLPDGHPPINSFLGVPLKKGEKIIGMIALANKAEGYSETDKTNIETLSAVFVEVLMRKKAEMKIKENMKRLAQSNKELEQFAYITSHDLREPLRMITSFLQLLERRYSDKLDQDANEFIEFAVNGAKRLDNMTNDLLLYSRVTSEKRVITLVNFEKVLEEAQQNLKVPIEENNAIITHDPLPTIMGDSKLKVQLFQNIIGNALKYRSDKPPEIHISAKKEKNKYLFSISDNGIGMSPAHLEKIFTIFQRLHSHEEYEGTGIGLAIAQKIVQQHGGKIWAESVLGKGSTFFFTVPISNQQTTLMV